MRSSISYLTRNTNLARFTAPFSLLRSTQILSFPLLFSSGTMGAHHSVTWPCHSFDVTRLFHICFGSSSTFRIRGRAILLAGLMRFLFDDINDIVNTWYNIFKAVINEHLPLKQKRVRRRNQPRWFNTSILKEIRIRDNLLMKAGKSNLERDWNLFKQAVSPV